MIYDEFHVVASKGVFDWEPQLTMPQAPTPHSAAGISGATPAIAPAVDCSMAAL